MWYVYELINLYGSVEYVGETTKPKYRLYQHTKTKPIEGCKGFGRFYGRQDIIMNIVQEFDNRRDALKLETELKIIHGLPTTEKDRPSKAGKIGGPIGGNRHKESGHIYKLAADIAEKTRISVRAFTIDGTFVGEYKSQSECADKLNVFHTRIREILKGKRKSTKGYTFKKIEKI